MTKLFFAASAAALLTVAGTVPSFAQSSASGSSMTMPSITCKDLSGMDKETARSVVFYFSGFNAASGSSQAMNSSSGSSTTTTGSGSSSTTADTGTTTGSGSTTADSGASGSSGSTTTDTTGSTTAAGGTSGSSDTSGASGSSTSGSGSSSAMVAQLPGFSSIDVDKIMTTCQSSPDKQLSEVIGSGATAQ